MIAVMGVVAKANKVGFSKVDYYKATGPGMGIMAELQLTVKLEEFVHPRFRLSP